MVGLCSLGLLNFKSEAEAWKLYLPVGSHHSTVQSWKQDHFVEDVVTLCKCAAIISYVGSVSQTLMKARKPYFKQCSPFDGRGRR